MRPKRHFSGLEEQTRFPLSLSRASCYLECINVGFKTIFLKAGVIGVRRGFYTGKTQLLWGSLFFLSWHTRGKKNYFVSLVLGY